MKVGTPARSVSVNLSLELWRRLQVRHQHEGASRSDLLRRALEQYLTQAEAPIVSPGRPWELEDNDQASSDIRPRQAPISGTGKEAE